MAMALKTLITLSLSDPSKMWVRGFWEEICLVPFAGHGLMMNGAGKKQQKEKMFVSVEACKLFVSIYKQDLSTSCIWCTALCSLGLVKVCYLVLICRSLDFL